MVWTCSLILARSTGQATTSWAAPPAHPAQKISQFVGFTEEERPPEEIPVLKVNQHPVLELHVQGGHFNGKNLPFS